MVELLSDAHWFSMMVMLSQMALLGIQVSLIMEVTYLWDAKRLGRRTKEYERYRTRMFVPLRAVGITKRKVPSARDHSSDDDENNLLLNFR